MIRLLATARKQWAASGLHSAAMRICMQIPSQKQHQTNCSNQRWAPRSIADYHHKSCIKPTAVSRVELPSAPKLLADYHHNSSIKPTAVTRVELPCAPRSLADYHHKSSIKLTAVPRDELLSAPRLLADWCDQTTLNHSSRALCL